jgi:predicted RNase H-like HicB family nuclease
LNHGAIDAINRDYRAGRGWIIALCPELDLASQGSSLEEARSNLIEALTLFFETADSAEISRRMHNELQQSGLAKAIFEN